jgi:hypothetical protein
VNLFPGLQKKEKKLISARKQISRRGMTSSHSSKQIASKENLLIDASAVCIPDAGAAGMSSDGSLIDATGQTEAAGFSPNLIGHHDKVSIDLAHINVFRRASDHQFYKQEVDDTVPAYGWICLRYAWRPLEEHLIDAVLISNLSAVIS